MATTFSVGCCRNHGLERFIAQDTRCPYCRIAQLERALAAYSTAHDEMAKGYEGGKLTNGKKVPSCYPDWSLVERAMEAGRSALLGEAG